VPAPLARVHNQYRFQIMLRTPQIMRLVEVLGPAIAAVKLPDDVMLNVDVDPISLL
jgi:primosomal protein N'